MSVDFTHGPFAGAAGYASFGQTFGFEGEVES